jgi:hypothetical protein
VPVSDIDEFKGHIGCPFHRVFIPAGGAKTAMAAKRNKFHLSAVRAAIHGSTEGWIATIDHLVHVFDYGSTWMEDINHFFVMVCKDFLKDIHMNIIEEMDGKKKPHPSRLRGRGVEVSKTLCSIISPCTGFLCRGIRLYLHVPVRAVAFIHKLLPFV